VDISRSLFETLKNLCRILGAAHVDHCLIGGLAVGILAVDDVSIPVANRELLIKIKELSGRPQYLLDIISLKEQ
jgi:hypothetical protein